MADRIDLSNILINFLKKARYERLIAEDELEENQFYATTDGNEKTEYGDLFGNIEDQVDLYNALYSSRIFTKAMCDDPRGYAIVKALKDSTLEYTLNSGISIIGEINEYKNYVGTEDNYVMLTCSGGPLSIDLYIKSPLITGNIPLHFVFTGVAPVTIYSNYNGNYSDLSNNLQILTSITSDGGWNDLPLCKASSILQEQPTRSVIKIKFLSAIDLTETRYTLGGNYLSVNSGDNVSSWVTTNEQRLVIPNYDSGTDTYPLYNITIPYVKSRDGVKIVDVQYKDQVDELYTQTGQGNYIIIDEVNETFRLPLPDIYSQIEKKTSFTLRKWED